jgi:hypothetical protein
MNDDDFSSGGAPANGVSPEVSAFMSDKAKKRWAGARANQSMKEAMQGGEPHPLFPTGQGEPIPQIEWINVCRFEPGRGPVDCPRVFPASELQSLEDLAGMYGGGRYELRGRASGPDGGPGPMLRYQRFTLDGDSLPFAGEMGAAAAGAAPAQNGATERMDPMMLFLTMQKESANEARASADRQMQLIVAMMTQSSQQQTASQTAMAQIMAAAMGSNKGPDLAGLLTAVAAMSSSQLQAFAQMAPKSDGTGDLDKIAKLIEISKAIKPDEDSITGILTGAGQAFAGFAQVAAMAAAAEAQKKQEAAAAQQQQQQPAQQQQQQPAQQQQQPSQANGHAPPPAQQQRPRNEAETLAT